MNGQDKSHIDTMPSVTAAVREHESDATWTISVPTRMKGPDNTRKNRFELCNDTDYNISRDAEKLRKEMETQPTSALSLRNGVYSYAQKVRQSGDGSGRTISIELPRSLPMEIKNIVKDALLAEAAQSDDFSRCQIMMDIRLETEENADNRNIQFHHDFENYRRATMYAVSGRPTTVWSEKDAAIGKTATDAIEAGIPVHSLLPDRMYRWTDEFIHATPLNRFEGALAKKIRPFVIIGFVYR